MGTGSTRESIILYRYRHLSFLKDGDEYGVEGIRSSDSALYWRPIDYHIKLAMGWLKFERDNETLASIHVARFVREYVGEARWALAVLENL